MEDKLIIMSDLIQNIMLNDIIYVLKEAQNDGYTNISIEKDLVGYSTYSVLVLRKGNENDVIGQ